MDDETREKYVTALNTPKRLERIDKVTVRVKEAATTADELRPVAVVSETVAVQHQTMAEMTQVLSYSKEAFDDMDQETFTFKSVVEGIMTNQLRSALLFCYGFFEDELQDHNITRVYENGKVVGFNPETLVLVEQELQ